MARKSEAVGLRYPFMVKIVYGCKMIGILKFILLILCLPLWADSPMPIGQNWTKIFGALEAAGIQQIGPLRFSDFRAESAQIEWHLLEQAPASVLSGARTSAFYLTGQKKIGFRKQIPVEALEALPQLELHEIFGALGYDDQDGALSMSLSILSRLKSKEQQRRLLKIFEKFFMRPKAITMAGGIGVSGGGDLLMFYLKDQVLQHVTDSDRHLDRTSSDFLSTYPLIFFEPMKAAAENRVIVKYEYQVKTKDESFSIFVPTSRWNKSAQERKQLIHEIAGKITELFSSRAGSASHSFKPNACRSNTQVAHYPKTSDPAIRSIQNFRAELQLGCRTLDSAMTDLSVMAPSVSVQTQPATAGHYYFLCEFRYGSAIMPYKISLPAGKSMQSSVQWSLTGNEALFGIANLSSDGTIRSTAILFIPQGGRPQRLGPQALINGQMLSFQCEKER